MVFHVHELGNDEQKNTRLGNRRGSEASRGNQTFFRHKNYTIVSALWQVHVLLFVERILPFTDSHGYSGPRSVEVAFMRERRNDSNNTSTGAHFCGAQPNGRQ